MHEVQEEDSPGRNRLRPEGNAPAAFRGVQVYDPRDGGHAGPCSSSPGLQAPVHDIRHGQDPEGEYCPVAVSKTSGAERIPVGRPSVEPVLLCCDGQ